MFDACKNCKLIPNVINCREELCYITKSGFVDLLNDQLFIIQQKLDFIYNNYSMQDCHDGSHPSGIEIDQAFNTYFNKLSIKRMNSLSKN